MCIVLPIICTSVDNMSTFRSFFNRLGDKVGGLRLGDSVGDRLSPTANKKAAHYWTATPLEVRIKKRRHGFATKVKCQEYAL